VWINTKDKTKKDKTESSILNNMSQTIDEQIVLMPYTLCKGGKNVPLSMPEVLGMMIQDFVRPDMVRVAAKKKWDAVLLQIKFQGECNTGAGRDSMAWGRWVNVLDDDEWERLMVEHAMTPEVEARMRATDWDDGMADEFLGLTFTGNWLEMIGEMNEWGLEQCW
tara:strand:+ start:964 stop:1458 length:495 start_codon:yes stop_codon:yes gene_type:complete